MRHLDASAFRYQICAIPAFLGDSDPLPRAGLLGRANWSSGKTANFDAQEKRKKSTTISALQ
jgi:hypothetical protein